MMERVSQKSFVTFRGDARIYYRTKGISQKLNMNTAFPLIAIAVAVVALVLSPSGNGKVNKPNPIPAILLIGVVIACGLIWKDAYADLLPASISFAAGVAVCLILRYLEGIKEASAAAAMGFAAALAGIIHWIDVPSIPTIQLAGIAGLAFGAWVAGDLRVSRLSLPVTTAAYGAVILATDFMGARALQNEPGSIAGTMFGLAGAIAALIALVANRSEKKGAERLAFMPELIAVAILLILGYVVGGRLVESRDAWLIFDGAVLSAVIVHMIIRPDAKDDSMSVLIGAVIWIGIATLAFSFMKGFGMAIAAAGAVLTLLVLGNPRAMLTVGPLIGFTFYRVLRESHPDAVRALDIGQHYGMIGIVFGVAAALLPAEWATRRAQDTFSHGVAKFLWAAALIALTAAMAVVLGAKGIVGFVAGVGFAGMIEALRGGRNSLAVVIAGGSAALVAVSHGWLGHLLDLTREDKQIAFYWIAGGTLVFAVLIAMFSKPDTETATELS
jgi:hypothetical protein